MKHAPKSIGLAIVGAGRVGLFRGEIAAREHQALLEAALIRDWKQAQTIMVSHIRGCVEHALREDHAGLFGSPANGLRPGTNKAVSATRPEPKSPRKAAKPGAGARRQVRPA